MTAPVFESALVVLAPEAEPLVKAFRDRWDPAAAVGVPAHVTVLYPFHPPATPAHTSPRPVSAELATNPAWVAPPVSARLAALFAEHAPFNYTLAELRRFPGVLYLAPEPAAPFRALTQSVATTFPDYPPYAGRFVDVIPHLTVAQPADPEHLDPIALDFLAACSARLPLRLRAEAVVLMDNVAGAWRVRSTFRLGR